MTKVPVTDVPWHLATARHALSHGGLLSGWPEVNTFSYTYPDHPLLQQYPCFQALLYGVFRLGGFEALSVLHGVAWTGSFVLWIAWARAWRNRHRLLLVLLLVLAGLGGRMILRPDMLTVPLFIGQLLLIDAFRATGGGRLWPLVGLVMNQWCLVNSHQMFTLGLTVQAAFLGHLGLVRWTSGRWGMSTCDRHLPLGVFAMAFGASIAVSFFTPLGVKILAVPATTWDSLRQHREHVSEFSWLFNRPDTLALVLVALALAAVSLWRRKHAWPPFDAFVCLLGLALAAGAVRGSVFAILLGAGVYARALPGAENWSDKPRESSRQRGIGVHRTVGVAVTLVLCSFILHGRFLGFRHDLFSPEPGVGPAEGQWPVAGLAFLQHNRPPGRMINLSWHTGNALIWALFPAQRVFVDPRFESYPRDFLLETIHALHDQITLNRLIETWDPGWLVGETRLPQVVARAKELVEGGGWRLVHVDPVFFIVVRQTEVSAAYLLRFPPGVPPPVGLSAASPNTRLLQLMRLLSFYDAFDTRRAGELRREIDGLLSRHPALRRVVTSRDAEVRSNDYRFR